MMMMMMMKQIKVTNPNFNMTHLKPRYPDIKLDKTGWFIENSKSEFFSKAKLPKDFQGHDDDDYEKNQAN